MTLRNEFCYTFLLALFLLFGMPHQFVSAQEFVVRGTVYDLHMRPLPGSSVVEVGTINGTVTDNDGKFSLTLSNNNINRIDISFVGYYTQSFDFADEPYSLTADTVYFDVASQMIVDTTMCYDPYPSYYRVYAFIFGGGVSRINADFSSFSELPGNYLSALSGIEYAANMDLGGYYNSIFGMANFGRSANFPSNENDSIDESLDMYGFGLKGGYGFASRRGRLIFTPFLGFDILWYQLVSSDPNETLPLGIYLANQYYHVTMRQWTSTIGANIDVKLFGSWDGSPWGYTAVYLRLGAGYRFRLSKHPFIKAPTNELSSAGKIELEKLFLQAAIVLYLQ